MLHAEELLRRVLPDPDSESESESGPGASAPVRGVDARTQAQLEAMGRPDRESW